MVDDHLLNHAAESAGNPVKTDTGREREAEDQGHHGHHGVHGLHLLRHGIVAVIASGTAGARSHKLRGIPLDQGCRNGDDPRRIRHEALERRHGKVDSEEIVHLSDGHSRIGKNGRDRRERSLKRSPLCRSEPVKEIDDLVQRRTFHQRRTDLFTDTVQDLDKSGLLHDRLCGTLKYSVDRRNISRNAVDDLIKSKQDRHLDQKEYTAAGHAGAVFRIDRLRLVLHAHHGNIVSLSSVFFLNRLELRLHDAHQSGRLLLLDRQRPHQKVNDQSEEDDAEADVGDAEIRRYAEQTVHDQPEDNCDMSDDRHR